MSIQRVSRRDFLKAMGFGAASLAMPGCMQTHVHRGAKGKRPNIIYIMADDLGFGNLGCYGGTRILTPSVDRMAGEGMRFTEVYAGHCVCAPSRSVLMTGQHTGHTRVRDNKCMVGGVKDEITGGGCRLPLLPEDVTVAEVLKQAGYATGITGKWGLGDPGTTGIPTRQGFDEWLGYLNQNHANEYYTDYLWRDEEKIVLEGNLNGKRSQYTHDMFAEFALDFIREHRNEPFFLYVPFTIPHFNHEVPSIGLYNDKPWKETEKIYAAMVTRMDKDIGRILDLLKELDIDEDTIVFFCSDNGGTLWGTMPPYRGSKGGLMEGGIRTPMIVRWPGKITAGAVSDARWYFADVMPTLAELAGAKAPENIDGVSVVPTLFGKKQDELHERFMYWEAPRELQQVVRWRNWKAAIRKRGARIRLYNLAEDPGEHNDVAEKHPDIVAVFEEYLRTARTETPNWPLPPE
ncbi:MAG: sulfatase-like hydrolase/transferase [Planctomycetota bacterium]|jgi:arylsulfatase A-like enzyme